MREDALHARARALLGLTARQVHEAGEGLCRMLMLPSRELKQHLNLQAKTFTGWKKEQPPQQPPPRHPDTQIRTFSGSSDLLRPPLSSSSPSSPGGMGAGEPMGYAGSSTKQPEVSQRSATTTRLLKTKTKASSSKRSKEQQKDVTATISTSIPRRTDTVAAAPQHSHLHPHHAFDHHHHQQQQQQQQQQQPRYDSPWHPPAGYYPPGPSSQMLQQERTPTSSRPSTPTQSGRSTPSRSHHSHPYHHHHHQQHHQQHHQHQHQHRHHHRRRHHHLFGMGLVCGGGGGVAG